MATLGASVAQTLLNQFIAFAQRAVDGGDAPQDAHYEKVLQGLQVAAAQAGPLVVDRIMTWRNGSLSLVKNELNELYRRRRLLVTDAVGLEAIVFLARNNPDYVPGDMYPRLETLAFDWLLEQNTFVEPRFTELQALKERVLVAVAELLGCVSVPCLGSVTERFLLEMGRRIKADSSSPARQQLYWMLQGMRFIQLRGDTPEQLRASANFLDRCHPLKHVASEHKSRLQQAIAEMLTAVVAPLAEEGDPSAFGAGCETPLRRVWAASVTTLRLDLLKWTTKQSKQVLSGLPAVAVLTCVEEDGQLVGAIEGLVDVLHKQLKDKRNASMALQCLAWCVGTFLRRMAPPRITRAKLADWAGWAVAPAIQGAFKGGLGAPEQQELLRQLCARVAPALPELAVGKMALELLAAGESGNWDAAMAGAMALLTILAAAPGRLAGGGSGTATEALLGLPPPGGTWLPPAAASRALLDLIQMGYNPLEAYGVPQLLGKASQGLSRLLQACGQLYGYARLTNPGARAVSDAAARERAAVLPVFVMALQCVPFVMPDHWADGRSFDELLGYTTHIEAPIRQVSTTVLRRMLRALPHLRDSLVGAAASFPARISEDYVEVIRDSAQLAMSLMREWAALVAQERAAGSAPDTPTLTSGSGSWLHRAEGAALCLLCSHDVAVRRLALELLSTARELHRTLSARPGPSSRHSTANPSQQRRPGTAGSVQNGLSGLGGRRVSQQSGNRAGSQQGVGDQSVPSTPSGSASLAVLDGPGAASRMVYVADVIDRSGNAVAQRCYWDLGRWSDLWRAWRPLPQAGLTFEQCLSRAAGLEDNVRWARLLGDLMREAWRRCEISAAVAHTDVAAKLQALLTIDSNGRSLLPGDGRQADLARAYCMALMAAPLPEDRDNRGARELVHMLVSTARSGNDTQQQVAVLALGHAHPSAHGLVVTEAAALVEDYAERSVQRSFSSAGMMGGGGRASRARKDDLRLAHANILRLLADNLPPGSLLRTYYVPETRKQGNAVRDRLVEWVKDAYRHITSVAELSPELQQLRHCLACVARHCSLQLAEAAQQAFPQHLRKQLFDLFSLWCEDGLAGGQYRHELRRSITSLKQRLKDERAAAQLEVEMADSAEVLEQVAYLGMAAVLNGPMFTADVRNPEGQVFSWADRMLSSAARRSGGAEGGRGGGAWGPPKHAVARSGLRYLLQSNATLAPVFVDKAYAHSYLISAGYFQVLAEVYCAQELPVAPEVLLSLVLHRVVDARQEVRDAARSLLPVLSRRAWGRESRFSESEVASSGAQGAPEAGGGGMVVGVLHDSQTAYQLRLSARLASGHPDLAEPLCLEVLARQLDNESGPEALLCLCPWLAHIGLGPHWEGQQAERLLHLLYRITATQGQRHAYQVQRLWATLGANRRNVVPLLDFLIERGLKEGASDLGETPCAVGKAVCLYLSRVAPAPTIDHLVGELSQQMMEPDSAGSHEAGHSNTPRILEYHHPRADGAAASDWQPSLPQPSAASTSGGSRPATPMGTPGLRTAGLGPLVKSHSAWSESSFSSSGAGGPGGGGGGTGADRGDGSHRGGVAGNGSAEAGAGAGAGGQHSPQALSRRSSDIRAAFAPAQRAPLTRPELALCLLSELAYEHDEELRRHLPALLQIVTLNADSLNVTVRAECAQLLTYLLHSLACKHLEVHAAAGTASPEYQRVVRLIGRLQALRGQPLWTREQPTLAQPCVASAADVAAFVQTVVDCFYFDTALRERWCAEALRWTCGAHSRHFASRSHQVFCALSPALSSASCTALLAALHKCLQSATAQGMDTAVEVLCTLRALLGNLGGGKVLLYPQLLLGALALLCSSVVRVGEVAMHILLQVLSQLDLGDPTVQNALLALLPAPDGGGDENTPPRHANAQGGQGQGLDRLGSLVVEDSNGSMESAGGLAAQLWPLGQGLLGDVRDVSPELGPWVALPQLVVKALFQPETQLLALEVLAAVARQVGRAQLARQCRGGAGGYPGGLLFSSLSLADALVAADEGGNTASGIEAVVGDAEVGLALSLGAALPWLWVHLTDEGVADTAVAYLEGTSSAATAVGWAELSAVLAALAGLVGLDAEPPALLMPLVQAMVTALFPTYARLVCQRLVEVIQRGAEPYQAAAVAALQAIFEVPGADLGEAAWFARDPRLMATLSAALDSPLGPAVLDLFQAMMRWQGAADGDRVVASAREGLEWAQCMDDLGESNKLCLEALSRVLEACAPEGLAGVGGGRGGQRVQLGAGGAAGSASAGDLALLPFLHG